MLWLQSDTKKEPCYDSSVTLVTTMQWFKCDTTTRNHAMIRNDSFKVVTKPPHTDILQINFFYNYRIKLKIPWNCIVRIRHVFLITIIVVGCVCTYSPCWWCWWGVPGTSPRCRASRLIRWRPRSWGSRPATALGHRAPTQGLDTQQWTMNWFTFLPNIETPFICQRRTGESKTIEPYGKVRR